MGAGAGAGAGAGEEDEGEEEEGEEEEGDGEEEEVLPRLAGEGGAAVEEALGGKLVSAPCSAEAGAEATEAEAAAGCSSAA